MIEQKIIQTYINNFRIRFTKYLKPNIGLKCNVFPAEVGGAIIEFVMGPELRNEDVFNPISETIQNALSQIKQNAFGGELNGFMFWGTNTIVENKRIVFIKDESQNEWNEEATEKDVKKIVDLPKKVKK